MKSKLCGETKQNKKKRLHCFLPCYRSKARSQLGEERPILTLMVTAISASTVWLFCVAQCSRASLVSDTFVAAFDLQLITNFTFLSFFLKLVIHFIIFSPHVVTGRKHTCMHTHYIHTSLLLKGESYYSSA